MRARRIRLLLTDCDGVLTDNGVYYSAEGESLKRFSIRDGMGVARLREAGIETGIMTGENSGSVVARARKLAIRVLRLGIRDKRAELERVCEEEGLTREQIAYIGDDVNDLELLRSLHRVSLTGVPGDAMPAVLRYAHYTCMARGGNGAFREFGEWVLALRSGERSPRRPPSSGR